MKPKTFLRESRHTVSNTNHTDLLIEVNLREDKSPKKSTSDFWHFIDTFIEFLKSK